MKKFLAYFLYTLLLSAIACACSDSLDIRQAYTFDLQTMPISKKVKEGETVEIRCQLTKEGNYDETKFFIRYFQTDGEGVLKLDDGTILKPNDLYDLSNETFRLYYTSLSSDQQLIDIYIEDNFGQVVQKTFRWQNNNGKDEDKE